MAAIHGQLKIFRNAPYPWPKKEVSSYVYVIFWLTFLVIFPKAMRNLIFIILFFTSTRMSSQITLENTYPDVGYFYGSSQLLMIDLEVSGLKYVAIDVYLKQIRFYHLDHSYYKTVYYTDAPSHPMEEMGMRPDIMYISEKLFDLDDGIEYMFIWPFPGGSTTIMDESGTELFSAPGEVPFVKLNIPPQQYPIYNTPVGTKMILSHPNGTGKVYSLPGELTTSMPRQLMENTCEVNVYPNPGMTEITVQAAAGKAIAGDLQLYNAKGTWITAFDTTEEPWKRLSIENLAAGQYFLVLSGDGALIPCGSFIKQ